MNEDLLNIIESTITDNDLENVDLNDNEIFKEVFNLTKTICSQFIEINTTLEDEIKNYLSIKQNMVKPPVYTESDLLYLKLKFDFISKIPQPEQRSDEWHNFRNNRLTASDLYSVIDEKAKSKRKQLLYKKCGGDVPFLAGEAIKHGIKFEPLATQIYEKRNNIIVTEFGCIPHPIVPFFGASPDGIVSYKSENKNYIGRMLEIKCPKSRKITGVIPPAYYAQIQGQLEVCDLEYCDFLECDFQIYTKDKYLADTESKEKGVIVELYDASLSKSKYYYYENTKISPELGNESN